VTGNHLPLVGFDRFIRREWLDRTLEFALAGESAQTIRAWMDDVVEGRDAARKTADVLVRWWLREYPETSDLRERALQLALEMPHREWFVLHWGMALVNFPLFHAVARTIGRLLRLQGEFKRRDITQRILEIYSNVGTIPRAVARIVQSMDEWEVIKRIDEAYKLHTVHAIDNDKALEWFVEVCVRAPGRDAWDLRDLLRSPEMFPFDIPPQAAYIARRSKYLTVQYEGSDREIVTVRAPK